MSATLHLMVRCAVALAACHCLTLASACTDGGDGFTEAEWEVIHSLSPLPDVDYDPTAARLGQRLFFETRLSGPLLVGDDGSNGAKGNVGEVGLIACSCCHVPESWFMDTRSNPNATSLGATWTDRNAPTLVNAIYHESFPWHGKFSSIADLMRGPLRGKSLMNATEEHLARVLSDHYQLDYDALFPDTPLPDPVPDELTELQTETLLDNLGYALEAYQRRLISRNAPFDRYVAGDDDAISEQAKRGLGLFIGDALCIECHNGPNFSDGTFHSLGFSDGDPGRGSLEGHEDEVGRFRTPGLRTVAETAPYMHAGQLPTLTDVVEFYWLGGGDTATHPAITPLDLDPGDIADLVAFLETLTGEPIPAELTEDTSYP